MLFLLPALQEQEKDIPSDLGKKPKRRLDGILRYLPDIRVGLRHSDAKKPSGDSSWAWLKVFHFLLDEELRRKSRFYSYTCCGFDQLHEAGKLV